MQTALASPPACEAYPGKRCSAPPFVRIGPKGRHLEIPDGYALIEAGEAQAGDLFANLMTSQWSPVDHADIGDDAINFDYLIRRQNTSVHRTAHGQPMKDEK